MQLVQPWENFIIFALEKFQFYLLETKVIIFSDHTALMHLLKKKESKPKLLRCILLLQEFNIEICKKKGAENCVADHLSRISCDGEVFPLFKLFPNDHLYALHGKSPWYADIVDYLVIKELP